MRARDSQREKLYRAERATKAHTANRFDSVNDIEKFVKRVINSVTWGNLVGADNHVRVGDGRGRRSACAIGTCEIRMPVWARTKQIVLHELAHIGIARIWNAKASWEQHREKEPAAHGREFAALYLRLVRRFLGADAHDELKASFIEHKVRFKKKRVISPMAMAKMRERGRLLAAAARQPGVE